MAAFETLSGLAGEIRACATSEQFDLSGYTEPRVRELMTTAFGGPPLESPTEMIRFTFVVGGGKLVRSRYAEDLPKWMTAALRDIGFQEDRSAACTFDCQGTYKQQHDTGQNLKTIIVFPRVQCGAINSSNSTGKPQSNDNSTVTINVNSPEYIVAACELSTFKDIVASKTSTWRQKKRLLKVIQDAAETFKSLEEKLVRGELLTPTEQILYDANSGQDNEKITWLQSEIKSMVNSGNISSSEKEELISSLKQNLHTLNEEQEKAKLEGNTKLMEKIEEKKNAISGRIATIEKISPITHRLRHGEEIQKLRLKLFPLIALQEKARSVSLTLDDLKVLEGKDEIEASILQLEMASKGWFEDQNDFDEKCKLEEKEAKSKYTAKLKAAEKKKASSKAGSGTQGRVGSSSSASSWSTVATKKKPAATSAGIRKTSGGSGFASAFGDDSDSDS